MLRGENANLYMAASQVAPLEIQTYTFHNTTNSMFSLPVQPVQHSGGSTGGDSLHGRHADRPGASSQTCAPTDVPGKSQDQHQTHQEGKEGIHHLFAIGLKNHGNIRKIPRFSRNPSWKKSFILLPGIPGNLWKLHVFSNPILQITSTYLFVVLVVYLGLSWDIQYLQRRQVA